ncbi:MAG: hypothetical protein SH809_01180 [Rhodothermales bacterium]|nr:hypothetical protein [Rhodothermales bacterium]
MEALIRDLIPHDPTVGLFVAPDIPEKKLKNALADYGKKLRQTEVVALYDATLLGTGGDGALFTGDRIVFQNSNLEPAHEVLYTDLIAIRARRKLMGGQKLELDVNRGRATIQLILDFSGKPDAAGYVSRFLEEAIQRVATQEMDVRQPGAGATDVDAVEQALNDLVRQGKLAPADLQRMMQTIL